LADLSAKIKSTPKLRFDGALRLIKQQWLHDNSQQSKKFTLPPTQHPFWLIIRSNVVPHKKIPSKVILKF